MKNVRSSGSASRLVRRYQLIQEGTGCEFPFTFFNPNPAAFTNFVITFALLKMQRQGFFF
jgi:hypothetical protein